MSTDLTGGRRGKKAIGSNDTDCPESVSIVEHHEALTSDGSCNSGQQDQIQAASQGASWLLDSAVNNFDTDTNGNLRERWFGKAPTPLLDEQHRERGAASATLVSGRECSHERGGGAHRQRFDDGLHHAVCFVSSRRRFKDDRHLLHSAAVLRAHEICDGVRDFGRGLLAQVERDLRRKAFAGDPSGQLRRACTTLPLNATALALDLEVKPTCDESGDTLARSGFDAPRFGGDGLPAGSACWFGSVRHANVAA
jgi:hypothetical protein